MRKRRFIIFLLFTFLAVGVASTSTDAQFWKKKSKRHKHKHDKEAANSSDSTQVNQAKSNEVKEPKKTKAQRKKEKKERKKREKEAKRELKKANKKNKGKKQSTVQATAGTLPTVVKKWSDIDYPPSERKSHYRVDILAPMYLDELVKNGYPVKTIPDKAVQGLDFYKGVQIAADTLKKALFDIDIYVHDVASLQESANILVTKNMMDSSDLIIGAVAAKDIPAVAGYAKMKHINFISTLSPADGDVKDNPYFTVIMPSLKSHCEQIIADIETKHLKSKVLLMYRTFPPNDNAAYSYLSGEAGKNLLLTPLLCNKLPAQGQIAALIDTVTTNIIVIPIQDNKFADSLLYLLKQDFPRTQFEIYGMPGWSSMANLSKPGAYPNLQVNITIPFSFNEQSATSKYVAQIFKTEYGGKPGEMVYRGYETMFWYANLLRRYGTIFNKQYSDNETAPFTQFTVKPQWDDKTGNVIYFENRHLLIRRYTNGIVSLQE